MPTNPPTIPRSRKLLLAALVFVLLFPGLGLVPLFDLDEGAFSEATREMVESGNYLMTYADGEPRYTKPILIYWFQALSVHLFGVNEFAVRLPSAVASAIWILMLFAFTRRHFGESTAFWAALFLATSVQVTLVMKAAISDALLNATISGAMFACYRFFDTGKKSALYVAAAAMALGFLTKGPIAVFIPVATAVCISAGTRSWSRLREAATAPLAWICFFGVATPWYVAAAVDQGRPFLDAIYQNNFGRYGSSMEGHSGPIYYYVLVLMVGFLPLTAILALGLWDAARPWWTWFRSKFPPSGEPPAATVPAIDQFLVFWFLIVFVFFSFSGTKLHHYVIYGYTPLFILMARRVDRLPNGAWIFVPAVLLWLALAAAPFTVDRLAGRIDDPHAQNVLRAAGDDFGWTYLAGCIAALGVSALCLAGPRASKRLRVAAVAAVTAIGVNYVVVPAAGRVLQAPVREAAHIAKRDGLDVKLYHVLTPSFVFYHGKLSAKGAPEPGDVVFSETAELDRLGEYEAIYEDNGYVLARMKSIADRVSE